MGEDVKIYDTTLRDGCQGAGIALVLGEGAAERLPAREVALAG